MGPFTGQWKRTPIWLQILGKPPLRRHLIWAHFEEWEYCDAAQVEAMEKDARALRLAPALVEQAMEAVGGKTEAILRRDGNFLTLEWWRYGQYLTARVYEPMQMKVSAALADLMALALVERPHAAVPPEAASNAGSGAGSDAEGRDDE